VLPGIRVAYHTWGTLNADASNVIWVCHALTANSDAQDWWPNMIGPGLVFDTDIYFVVCANMLGSCYGSTGPTTVHPQSNLPWFQDFPTVTVRDMVNAHKLLAKRLKINRLALLTGGSMGGQQALEWAWQAPDYVAKLLLLATNAQHSPWGIAFNEAQRMALHSDPTFFSRRADGGTLGLRAARAIAMLSYRSYEIFGQKQADPAPATLDDYRAASYQRYQGEKLSRRFSAHSYYMLTKAMDSHNLARNRAASLPEVLTQIPMPTLVMGIRSDVLFPVQEQRYLAAHIPNAQYIEIDSDYGHDGFLIETPTITAHTRPFLAA
jgi:homoserine O-acetyltransferase